MATGSQALLSMRGALGASEGAATTPTRLLYPGVPDNIDLTGLQQFETIEDRVAWAKRDQVRDVYNGIERNAVTLSGVPASYEDIGFYLSTIPGIVSGAGTGAGTPTTTDTSAYTRTFTPSQTVTAYGATGGYDLHLQVGAADLIATWGLSIPGLRCSSFNIGWRKRASGTDTGLTFGGTWHTPKTATAITAFTGSLTDRTQTLPTGNVGKSYIDTSTQGSTADANVTEASWTLESAPAFHDGLDNTGLPTSMHFPNPFDSRMSVTRKFSDLTELNAYIARTLRKIRLISEGAVVGATTAKNTITLNFIGKPVAHTNPVWIDGMWYSTIEFLGVYDATLLASWSFTSINTTSTAYTAV